MKLAYAGYDLSGRSVAGVVEAPTRVEASDVLRKQGILATEVREAEVGEMGEARAGKARRARGGGGARRMAELAGFARQLSILISAKTPMVQALMAVERQTPEGEWRDVLAALRLKVEEGVSLSEAMEQFPGSFSPICRALVSAGEAGGTLDTMLRGLADMTRQQLHMRKQVMGAMTYPVVLVTLSSVVLTSLVLFVLPRFEELFKSIGATLPPSTEFLIELSKLLRENWYIVVPVVAGAIVAAVVAMKTPSMRARVQGLALQAPRIGPLMRAFATARIARVLGTLLEAKVGVLDSLQLTRHAASHAAYADLLMKAEDRLTRGENLSAALDDPTLMTPSIIEAIASAEKTGQVGPVLVQVAKYMDEDNEVLIRTLTSLIEPLILTFLGILIGGVAIAMFLPLFDLTAAGANGGPVK